MSITPPPSIGGIPLLTPEEKIARRSATIKIQSFWRGYRVRRELALANLKAECAHTLTEYNHITISIQEAIQRRLDLGLNQTDAYTEKMRNVRTLKLTLCAAEEELRARITNSAGIPLSSLRRFVRFTQENLHHEITKLGNANGYSSLLEGIETLLRGDTSLFSASCGRRLVDIDTFFQLTNLEVLDVVEHEDGVSVLTTPLGDFRIGEWYHEGVPHFQKQMLYSLEGEEREVRGAELLIPLKNGRVILARGLVNHDANNLIRQIPWIAAKASELQRLALTQVDAPVRFMKGMLEHLALRDVLCMTPSTFRGYVSDSWNEVSLYKHLPVGAVVSRFTKADACGKLTLITALVVAEEIIKAGMIFRGLEKKVPFVQNWLFRHLHTRVQTRLGDARSEMEAAKSRLTKLRMEPLSLREKVALADLPEEYLSLAAEKLKEAEGRDSSAKKAEVWLERFLKLPLGKFAPFPLEPGADRAQQVMYLDRVRETLDTAVDGHDEAKEVLEELFGQWVRNGGVGGAVVAIQGPPGNGKTTLAREGIAKALGRPFVEISLGGLSDGKILKGHSATYISSKAGRIAEMIQEAGVMNPVIYLDEIDKVSATERGQEIIGILTHLLDQSQNDHFQDDFFAGVRLDLSQVVFVITYNNRQRIDGVLHDRFTHIKTEGLARGAKHRIAHKFLLPAILEEVGLSAGDVSVTDEALDLIISNYTDEKGARELRRCLLKLVRRLNLQELRDPEFSFPGIITESFVQENLKPREREEIPNLYT